MLLPIPTDRSLAPDNLPALGHRAAAAESFARGRAYNPNRYLGCRNNSAIKQMIIQKLTASEPIEPSASQIMSVATDVDHWPYTRHFRGVYNSSEPTVWGRNAGYRARCDVCHESSNTALPPSGETRAYYTVYR